MTDAIFDAAKALYGSQIENETALLTMCGAACQEFSVRLREDVTPESVGDSFVQAAAMLGLSLYLQLRDADDCASFKAGIVSVSRRGAGSVRSSVSALRRQAETLLAPWLNDGDFVFRGVQG